MAEDEVLKCIRVENEVNKKLSQKEVAWLFSTDEKTVRLWSDTGLIKPHFCTDTIEPRFRRADITQLLIRCGA